MAQIIGMSMPRGYAGQISRGFNKTIVKDFTQDGTIVSFGQPVAVGDDGIAKLATNAADVKGFAVLLPKLAFPNGCTIVDKAVAMMLMGFIYVTVNLDGKESNLKPGASLYMDESGNLTGDTSKTKIEGVVVRSTADSKGLIEISMNLM